MRLLVLGASSTPICGVRQVAGQLERALQEQVDTITTCWWDRQPDAGVKTQRASLVAFSQAVEDAVRTVRPDWVILHYSVFTWGIGGVPILTPYLTRLIDDIGCRVAVVLHEYALPLGWRQVRLTAISLTQRAALAGLLKRCDVAIVTTEQRLAALKRVPGGRAPRLAFLPNPSPVPVAALSHERSPDAPIRIGVLGWATPGYPADVVADAVGNLLATGHAVQLSLVGSPGPDTPPGRAWSIAATRAGVISTFTGVLDDDGLSRALAGLDLLVFPDPGGPASRKSTLAAALAHGNAIVAFDGPDRWQALIDARAVVLAPPDAEGLASVVAGLLSDDGRPLAEARTRALVFAQASLAPRLLAERLVALLSEPGS